MYWLVAVFKYRHVYLLWNSYKTLTLGRVLKTMRPNFFKLRMILTLCKHKYNHIPFTNMKFEEKLSCTMYLMWLNVSRLSNCCSILLVPVGIAGVFFLSQLWIICSRKSVLNFFCCYFFLSLCCFVLSVFSTFTLSFFIFFYISHSMEWKG